VPITLDQVIALLAPDEPDYRAAAEALGPEAAPHLERLVAGPDEALATKAAYLASLIGPEADRAVLAAAEDSRPVVRVAAATGLRNLESRVAVEAAERLLGDNDAGVRKTAIRSAPGAVRRELRGMIERLSKDDPDEAVRGLSRDALKARER
jgi:HEAT repeat protein